jgi:hypothetical protein
MHRIVDEQGSAHLTRRHSAFYVPADTSTYAGPVEVEPCDVEPKVGGIPPQVVIGECPLVAEEQPRACPRTGPGGRPPWRQWPRPGRAGGSRSAGNAGRRRLRAGVLKRQAVLVDPLVCCLQGGHELLRANDENDAGGAPGVGGELAAGG